MPSAAKIWATVFSASMASPSLRCRVGETVPSGMFGHRACQPAVAFHDRGALGPGVPQLPRYLYPLGTLGRGGRPSAHSKCTGYPRLVHVFIPPVGRCGQHRHPLAPQCRLARHCCSPAAAALARPLGALPFGKGWELEMRRDRVVDSLPAQEVAPVMVGECTALESQCVCTYCPSSVCMSAKRWLVMYSVARLPLELFHPHASCNLDLCRTKCDRV